MNDGKMEKIIEKERIKMGFKKAKINEIPYSKFNTSEEWMAIFKIGYDIGIQKEKTVNELIKLIGQNVSPEKCSSFSDCNYLRGKIDSKEITLKDANTYVVLICENYSGACQLNKF
jgi:hypothetical protein